LLLLVVGLALGIAIALTSIGLQALGWSCDHTAAALELGWRSPGRRVFRCCMGAGYLPIAEWSGRRALSLGHLGYSSSTLAQSFLSKEKDEAA